VAIGLFILSLVVSLLICVLLGALLELINPSFWFSNVEMGYFVFALSFVTTMVDFPLFSFPCYH